MTRSERARYVADVIHHQGWSALRLSEELLLANDRQFRALVEGRLAHLRALSHLEVADLRDAIRETVNWEFADHLRQLRLSVQGGKAYASVRQWRPGEVGPEAGRHTMLAEQALGWPAIPVLAGLLDRLGCPPDQRDAFLARLPRR